MKKRLYAEFVVDRMVVDQVKATHRNVDVVFRATSRDETGHQSQKHSSIDEFVGPQLIRDIISAPFRAAFNVRSKHSCPTVDGPSSPLAASPMNGCLKFQDQRSLRPKGRIGGRAGLIPEPAIHNATRRAMWMFTRTRSPNFLGCAPAGRAGSERQDEQVKCRGRGEKVWKEPNIRCQGLAPS